MPMICILMLLQCNILHICSYDHSISLIQCFSAGGNCAHSWVSQDNWLFGISGDLFYCHPWESATGIQWMKT